MQLQDIYQLFLKHPVVTTDSRNCPPNSLFFALKGNAFNGNTYAHKAIEQGCSFAFVDEPKYTDDERIILVDDCLKVLQQLANYHRKQFTGKVIGITGTNGKTTTKELLAAVLSKKYQTLYTQGNLNNHIGVPLTLLRLTNAHDIAVIEMGANHCGEIKTLCEIAEPDFGIITNVGKGHLEGFGSFDGVIQTKGELYKAIQVKNGIIFINHENSYLQAISDGITKVEYGKSPELYVSGNACNNSPYFSFEWRSSDNKKTQFVKTQLVGEYNLENILAAIAVGKYLDVGTTEINAAVNEYIPQNNRSQLKETEHNSLIIDAYNANPSSMEASLMNFSHIQATPKAVILGDMLELGTQSQEEHQKIIDVLNAARFEKVFLIGTHFLSIENSFCTYPTTTDFINYLQANPLFGYTILIKGSRGYKLEQVIDYL